MQNAKSSAGIKAYKWIDIPGGAMRNTFKASVKLWQNHQHLTVSKIDSKSTNTLLASAKPCASMSVSWCCQSQVFSSQYFRKSEISRITKDRNVEHCHLCLVWAVEWEQWSTKRWNWSLWALWIRKQGYGKNVDDHCKSEALTCNNMCSVCGLVCVLLYDVLWMLVTDFNITVIKIQFPDAFIICVVNLSYCVVLIEAKMYFVLKCWCWNPKPSLSIAMEFKIWTTYIWQYLLQSSLQVLPLKDNCLWFLLCHNRLNTLLCGAYQWKLWSICGKASSQ